MPLLFKLLEISASSLQEKIAKLERLANHPNTEPPLADAARSRIKVLKEKLRQENPHKQSFPPMPAKTYFVHHSRRGNGKYASLTRDPYGRIRSRYIDQYNHLHEVEHPSWEHGHQHLNSEGYAPV